MHDNKVTTQPWWLVRRASGMVAWWHAGDQKSMQIAALCRVSVGYLVGSLAPRYPLDPSSDSEIGPWGGGVV